MSPDEIKHILRETFARFETHFRDPEKVLEHVHEDVDWEIMGTTAVSGKRSRADMIALIAGLPGYTDSGMGITMTNFLIDGDQAAVEGTSSIRMKDGREYANRYHWRFELRDGKIAAVREYMDTALAQDFFGRG